MCSSVYCRITRHCGTCDDAVGTQEKKRVRPQPPAAAFENSEEEDSDDDSDDDDGLARLALIQRGGHPVDEYGDEVKEVD